MPPRYISLTVALLVFVIQLFVQSAAATPIPITAEQDFLLSVERLAIQGLIKKGSWEEVYARSLAGLAVSSTDPFLLRAKIRALRQLGYSTATRKALQEARLSHPTDAGLLIEQAWLASTAGEWQSVLTDTANPAVLADAESELLLLRGIALRETGKTDAAIALFSRLLERNPDDCVVLTNRGRLLARSGQESKALADLAKATACTTQPEPFLARATLLLKQGKHGEALPDLNRALVISPGNLTALLARSEARFLAGDIPGAGQDLQVAREINTADPRIEPLSCRLGSAVGDWTVVAGCAEQAAKQTPKDPAVWRTLGKARLEAGNLDGAIVAYDTLVQLAGNDPRSRLERATAQLLRRDYAAAAVDCTAVIDQQPLAIAYALRALAHFRAGKSAQADEDSTNALVLDRNEQTATLVRANLALEQNDLTTATSDCERAFRRTPNSSWGAITCGRVYLQAGDLAKATFYAERARGLAPADPETRDLIAKLDAVRLKTGGSASSTSNPPTGNEIPPVKSEVKP